MTSSNQTHIKLPGAERSVAAVLWVQALNAFGDNLVKLLLIGVALGVASGTQLGDKMQVYLGIVFAVPYVIFGPLAGFLSDRFSKRHVILWTQVAQGGCYLGFALALGARSVEYSLSLCLAFFFVLSTQAALLSPARSGIMKDLVGSNGLGKVNGLLQMAMMAGILGGIGAGGWLYKRLRDSGWDAWDAAIYPVYFCVALNVIQILASLLIIRTPKHPEIRYHLRMWWQHLNDLGLVFKEKAVGTAVSAMVFFWFMSYAVGTIVVGLGKDKFHGNDGAAAGEVSIMSALIGVGVIIGGLLGGHLCRRRIELGVVPIAGLGIAIGLFLAWLLPDHHFLPYVALGLVGISGGVFLVPLAAYVQDRAASGERARILAGAHLLDSLVGGLGSSLLVWLMIDLGISSRMQLGIIGIISLVATLCLALYWSKDLRRILLN